MLPGGSTCRRPSGEPRGSRSTFHHLVYVAAFAGVWHLMEQSETDRSLRG